MDLTITIKAFQREGLDIVDENQLEEVARWSISDFGEYKEDAYISSYVPVIICGCGRSGTTLTRVILDTHSKIYSGPEALLFLPTEINPADIAVKFNIPEEDVKDMLASSNSRSEFIDKFQKRILEDNEKAIWADKTARNVHCLPYILEHFPNAKIIHVIRNPLDVVASLRTHKKRKIEDGEIKNTGYVMPVVPAIERWKRAVSDGISYRGHKNYHEVLYENLTSSPEQEIIKLCDFIGVDYEPQMLDFHEVSGHTRDYTKFPQNVEATKPLSQSSVGRYQRILDQSQIDLVRGETAELVKKLGYWNTRKTLTAVKTPNSKGPQPG